MKNLHYRPLASLVTLSALLISILGPILARRHVSLAYEMDGLYLEGKAVVSGLIILILGTCLMSLTSFGLALLAYKRGEMARTAAGCMEVAAHLLVPVMWVFAAEPVFVWIRG
jgi:hypothetical protein